MVVRHSYTRHRAGAKRSLGYFIHRPGLESEHRTPFTVRDGELREMTRREATELISCHQTNATLYHRLMLAPSDHEDAKDLREMTSALLSRLEQKKGVELDWVAIEHHNTKHPHVHVLVSGYGENLDTREVQRVTFDKGDYADLRGWGHEWCRDLRDFRERQMPEEREPKNRMISRQEELTYRGPER